MKPAFAEKVAMLFAVDDDGRANAYSKTFSAFKTKSAPSARSAFAFIVGLNRYYLLMIAVMVAIMIMMMFVIVIVPVSITVPAAAFHVPPLVGVPPAVFPRIV
jgi:hypothetical protein